MLVPAVAAVAVWLWSVKTRTQSAAHTEMEVTTGDRTTYHNFDGQTVEADIAGEVAGVYIEEDGLVNAFGVTLQIVDLDRLEAELEIDEYDKAGSGLRQNRLCGLYSFEPGEKLRSQSSPRWDSIRDTRITRSSSVDSDTFVVFLDSVRARR